MNRKVFGDQHLRKASKIIEDFGDLVVAKMLENLANQAQISRRQRIGCNVGTLKAKERISLCAAVMLDQLGDYVDACVRYAGGLGDLPSDGKVTASQINDAAHIVFPNEVDHEGAILLRGRVA